MKNLALALALAATLCPQASFASLALDSGSMDLIDFGAKQVSSDVQVIALNEDTNLGGRRVAKGSELLVDDKGNLVLVGDGDRADELVDLGVNLRDLDDSQFTRLKQDEQTGELEPYNIPDDFQVAGPGGHRHRRGGVTNCYHVVKALVRRRITLTGGAAYMAAPQLRAKGWQRYEYASAPFGSVCVFGAGGKATASGGQRYGHVGVKGAGGIANPESGFHLGRPFLGCWHE